MPPVLTDLLDGVLSLLFPPRCEACGTLQEPVLCTCCTAEISRITTPFCRQCGLPFDPLAQAMEHCADCREDPPPFDAARAAARYSDTLRRAIHVFKYDGGRALALPLTALLAETVTLPFPIDALVPVPLHPIRERMRGFNQSRLLADALGTHWNLPVDDLMQRTRNIPPQMRLTAEERRRNVHGAFAVTGSVAERSLGLIDDVYTTGSTLRECSRVLKRAGAVRICVLTIARAQADIL